MKTLNLFTHFTVYGATDRFFSVLHIWSQIRHACQVRIPFSIH